MSERFHDPGGAKEVAGEGLPVVRREDVAPPRQETLHLGPLSGTNSTISTGADRVDLPVEDVVVVEEEAARVAERAGDPVAVHLAQRPRAVLAFARGGAPGRDPSRVDAGHRNTLTQS